MVIHAYSQRAWGSEIREFEIQGCPCKSSLNNKKEQKVMDLYTYPQFIYDIQLHRLNNPCNFKQT